MINIKDKELEKVNIPLNSVYAPVIPCALDGNLSFLEVLWKILYHINVIVDGVNANHGDIEDLAQAINELDADKLSVMWVELDLTVRPIKANKTFAEIAEGMKRGIVFLTISINENKIIAIPVAVTDNSIIFYHIESENAISFIVKSDESVTMAEYQFATTNLPSAFFADVSFNEEVSFFKHSEFTETTRFYKLITADSGILVPTATAASSRGLAANIEYVGNVCSETLSAAKTYADTQDTAMLTAAKEYSDKQDTAIQKAAKIYTDTKCGETLAAARTYADTQDETNLASAKEYTDNKFVHISIIKNADGSLTADNTFSTIYLNITRGAVVDVKYSSENNRNSIYIMRNTIITPTKLTFIGYDETATLHTCTIDSDNNIVYT